MNSSRSGRLRFEQHRAMGCESLIARGEESQHGTRVHPGLPGPPAPERTRNWALKQLGDFRDGGHEYKDPRGCSLGR